MSTTSLRRGCAGWRLELREQRETLLTSDWFTRDREGDEPKIRKRKKERREEGRKKIKIY